MTDQDLRYVLFDLETRDILGINRNKPALNETYFEISYKAVSYTHLPLPTPPYV